MYMNMYEYFILYFTHVSRSARYTTDSASAYSEPCKQFDLLSAYERPDLAS